MRPIGCKQGVQQSCACARKANDEKRLSDFLASNLWMHRALTLKKKTIAKLLCDIGTQGEFSH